jgi:hypothetical protein
MGIYRVTFTGNWQNIITCQNVVHFADRSEFPLTHTQVMVELRDNWLAIMATRQTNKYGWRNITIQTVGSGANPSSFPIVVNGADGVDNIGGTMVTNLKLRINTDFAGKKGKGRIYMPALRDQFWESGQIQASAIPQINTMVNALQARYQNVGGLGPLILGVHGRGPEASGFHACVTLTYSLIPGIQRRRNLGVGI